ncbi:MAG: hypothetical protein V7L27_05210 [Nostoc sp.]
MKQANTWLLEWMALCDDVYDGLRLRTNHKIGSSKLIPYSRLPF